MKFLKIFFIFCLPFIGVSQTVKGIIYDAETTIKGAKLVNTTKNILSYSDGKGNFEIKASLNDTIVVSSYFHEPQSIILNQKHFNQDFVIELKKITNELDQVEITKAKEKPFDSLNFKKTTAKQGQIAFKERMIGSGDNLQPTLDVLKLAKLIGKLFKKETLEIPTIKTADFITLFENSGLFTEVFLRDELGISKVHEFLFFEYLQAQHLKAYLLSRDNEFLLLDKLLEHGKSFNSFLAEHQDD